ncbi:MAG: hypothetical protein GXO58_00610 [Thermodesulfobacteria bacterium]|nr:hypothetical protein [Thermodesulfobacteriota bacterium]
MGKSKNDNKKTEQGEQELELLQIHVRADLYRAFRRCVWMMVYETGLPIVEVHNRLIEDLLKKNGC